MAISTTTREASPAHVLLKIESFSLLDKCGIDKYESQEFEAGNNKWRLVIYPKGNGTEKSGDSFSVYVAILGTDSLPKNWEVNAVFTIFILNQITGNYHHTIGNTRRFFGSKTEWVVPYFISKKDLITPSNGFLIDGRCMFGAEVFAIDNIKAVTRCFSFKDATRKHEIKISEFSKLKDEIWFSEEFTAGGYKWKIRLYPNGVEEEAGRSVSIFLEYVPFDNKNSDVRVNARFTISVKHKYGSHKDTKYTCSQNWFGASSLIWGWPSFISRHLMNGVFCEFITDDTCLLEIEISVQAVSQ